MSAENEVQLEMDIREELARRLMVSDRWPSAAGVAYLQAMALCRIAASLEELTAGGDGSYCTLQDLVQAIEELGRR